MKHSKGSVHTDGCKGRLAQLEERLVCNQKAGGSNPPASTILRALYLSGELGGLESSSCPGQRKDSVD